MKTAIIFSTWHGSTEKCSILLADKLKNVELINLGNKSEINLDQFETLIIGGSVHIGMINKSLKRFIDKNIDKLLPKKIGLFICCMEENEKAQEQFDKAFPENLRKKAIAKGFFGGELCFEKMTFIEKTIIKQIINIEENYSSINYQAISNFAAEINRD